MKAKASYSVKKWEEVTYREIPPDMKMTKASVQYELTGGLQGIASVEYLMFYQHFDPKDQHKASASYVGLIHFDGVLMGKSGSFAFEDNGAFEGGSANSSSALWKVQGQGRSKGFVAPEAILRTKMVFIWNWITISPETFTFGSKMEN